VRPELLEVALATVPEAVRVGTVVPVADGATRVAFL